MNRAMLILAAAIPLSACGSEPSVNETNASVEEVSEKVREASRDEGFVKPGKWVSTVTVEKMEMPGMPPETAQRMKSMLADARTAETCLTEEDVKRPKEDFFAGNEQCRYDHFTMARGKIDAAMRCSQDGVTQLMEMNGTYSPESYAMRMKSRTEGGPGGEPMTMQMKVDAKRVGACDSAEG